MRFVQIALTRGNSWTPKVVHLQCDSLKCKKEPFYKCPPKGLCLVDNQEREYNQRSQKDFVSEYSSVQGIRLMSDSKSQSTFINNTGSKVLKDRISKLIGFSKELKFLVGFFYFSGIRELYDAIRNNPNVITRVLVGLNVDKQGYGLIEYGALGKIDGNKHQLLFKDSIIKAINSDEFDTKEFYEQAKFFIQAILDNKLIIKKTRDLEVDPILRTEKGLY